MEVNAILTRLTKEHIIRIMAEQFGATHTCYDIAEHAFDSAC